MNHSSKRFRVTVSLLLIGILHTATAHAAKELLWSGCGISKLGFMQDLSAAYEKKTGIKIKLEGGGATKGLRNVADNHSDLGGSCRLPLILENRDGSFSIEATEKSIKIIPLGWDALVAIVNKENNLVEGISMQQLRDVLTGEINNWKQLGGPDKPINLYIRKGKISGVGLTLRQQLFNNSDQEFSSKSFTLASSGKIEKAVESDPYALAVSGVSSSRHRNVKILKLEGSEATMDELKAGKYPLYRLLFLVAPHDLKERPEIQDFIRFALSPEGQKVTKSAGTLPYHQGIRLIFNGTSPKYLHAIQTMEDAKIYTLSGQ